MSIEACSRRFAVDVDGSPTTLWLGFAPLTVYDTMSDGCSIYLQQGSNLDQYRYQLGHETFHRVCGPDTAHWVHEMLAELFTFDRLRETGHKQYAVVADAYATAIAPSVSLSELHGWSGGTGPMYYARAYSVGQALIKLCGWGRTSELVHFYDEQSRPDARRWAQALPADLARQALRIMGLSEPRQ